MPIPVLFTIPNFITAGSGRAMLNVVERLDRSRFAPAVCVMKKGGDLDAEVERLGIPLLDHPFTIPARPHHTFVQRARAAARAFRPFGFRLWHSFHYLDDYTEAVIARLAGTRYWVYTKKNMNWHRRSWYLRTLLASGVAAQNTDMLGAFFAPRWFRQKTHLIPRGIVTDRFQPGLPGTLRLRQHLGIPEAVPLLGCVAHLVPVKGHPTLIDAVADVPGAHLLLAGKPLDRDYVASLHHQADRLGVASRVHFLGDVTDVPAFLAEIDVVVLPTWAKWRMEGCPVALLEALACQKACIATAIPGARDIVEHGKSGLLIPPEDSAALAEAIRRLVASPGLRTAMGTAARARVMERYTIEIEVAAHMAFYSRISGLS